MPVITARIIQSTGLDVNKSAILSRELGVTSDTERPVIGTTVAGAKYIRTEEYIGITTAAPAALPILRRSITTILCDTTTAGASIALNIQAGAQIAGARVRICTQGPGNRQAVVTYGGGLIEYIPQGMSQEFVWTGSAWIKTMLSNADRYLFGSFVPSGVKQTPSCNNPVLDRSINQDISETNYPVAVQIFRAEKVNILGVENFNVTVTGSNVVFTDAAVKTQFISMVISDAVVSKWKNDGQPATLPAADYALAGTQQCITIAGVDYLITGATLGTWTIAVSGTPPAGAQVASMYPYRIVGSTTTARLLSLSGFVGVVAGEADGKVINGKRILDTGQGHMHKLDIYTVAGAGPALAIVPGGGAPSAQNYITIPLTDGVSGVPRTDKNTSPRTIGQFCYQWLGVYK